MLRENRERIDKVNESVSSSKTLGRSLNLHDSSPHFLVASCILTVFKMLFGFTVAEFSLCENLIS